MTPELRKREVHLQEQIRVRKFCYRTRFLMMWLLVVPAWLVPWYAGIQLIIVQVITAAWTVHDVRVHRRLVDQLAECRVDMSWMGIYR